MASSEDLPAGAPGTLSKAQRLKLNMLPPAIGPALMATIIGGCVAPRHLGYATLAGLWYATMLGVGALLFVLAQHAFRLRWGVIPRRVMEWVGLGFAYQVPGLVALCAIAMYLYPWAAGAPTGMPWERFTMSGFWVRSALYLIALIAVGVRYAKWSARQDGSGDPEITASLRSMALPSLLIVLVVSIGIGTDWVGGLAPSGFTTAVLFALYSAAGGLAGALSLAVLVTLGLERAGLLPAAWTAQRGKLVTALIGALVATFVLGAALGVFVVSADAAALAGWGGHYVGGSWPIATALLLGAHGAGFLLLLAGARSRGKALVAGAACVLLGRYLDAFQLMLPAWSPAGPPVTVLIEIMGLAAGMAGLWVGFNILLVSRAVYPVRDPDLETP